jgi:hypothetical protein
MSCIPLRPLAWLTAGLSILATVVSVGFDHQSVHAATPAAQLPVPTAESPKDDVPALGPVKWHKSFEAAKATSLKSGKPILLFRTTRQQDKQVCGATFHSVGTLLFSPEITDYINANFEPVWTTVRSASLVITNMLDTTKWGSPGSITYICDHEGVVYDVLSGAYPLDVYREQLEVVKRFADSIRAITTTRDTPTETERQRAALTRETRLREYHRQRQAELRAPMIVRQTLAHSYIIVGANAFELRPLPNLSICGGFNCWGGINNCNGTIGSYNFGFPCGFCGSPGCCGGVNGYNGIGSYNFIAFENYTNRTPRFYGFGSFGASPSGYYGFSVFGSNPNGFSQPPLNNFGSPPFK